MTTQQSRNQGGELLAAISKRIVSLLRETSGRGPTQCKTYWVGSDMVIVRLDGGYSTREHSLTKAGHSDAVLEGRAALQASVGERMQHIVSEETGRAVVAFMSTANVEPDMMVEIFALAPHDSNGGGAPGSRPE